MTRPFRLTRRAEASLTAIADWTFDSFGTRQAEIYGAEVLARCAAIAAGQVASRSCAMLLPGADNLRYARAGAHFVVFLDLPDAVIIIDFLHERSDLPRHIAALADTGPAG